MSLPHANKRLVGPYISYEAHAKLGYDPCKLIVRSFIVQGSPLMIRENVNSVDVMGQEHVGASCSSNVALLYSNHVTSSCIEEERCDDEIDFIHGPYGIHWRDVMP